MIDQIDEKGNQLGVVLVWAERKDIGRCGYLSPLRNGFIGNILFFDESSLANLNDTIHEGDLVHYAPVEDQGCLKAVNIQLEQFITHDPRLNFDEEDDSKIISALSLELQDPKTPVIKLIRSKMSGDLCKSLEREIEAEYSKPERDRDRRDGFGLTVAQHLNSLMKSSLLFNKYKFVKVKLRNQTRLLLNKKSGVQGNAVCYLNRLLLEDAIASEIPRLKPLKDCSTPIFLGEVESLEHDEYGWLKLESGSVRFSYNLFPTDSLIPQVGTKVQCRLNALSHDMVLAYDVWEVSQTFEIAGNSEQAQVESLKMEVVKLDADIQSSKVKGGRRGRTPIVRLTLPLQYDWDQELLISANKISSPSLPLKFTNVLKAWFFKNPINTKSHVPLSYSQIAEFFLRGKFMKQNSKIDEQSIKFRLDNQGIKENPARLAQEFARDFSRWLKKMGIPSEALFACDRKSQCYYLVSSGWHEKEPVVRDSEASLVFVPDREYSSKNKSKGRPTADSFEDREDAS